MAIPNTTPTPNELYNGEMKKMTDTELRVVLVVTRATLGWEIDHETGRRKQEDWIASSQIIEKTGRGERAITHAIDSCVRHGWIEARDRNGDLLNTPARRAGKKIYFRLGRIFLDRITSATSAEDDQSPANFSKTSAKSAAQPPQNLRATKETLTKENIPNTSNARVAGNEINPLIELFEAVNPSYERLYANRTERAALERLLKKHGEEKLRAVLEELPSIISRPYAPRITTPCELERKAGQLKVFLAQERNRSHRTWTVI